MTVIVFYYISQIIFLLISIFSPSSPGILLFIAIFALVFGLFCIREVFTERNKNKAYEKKIKEQSSKIKELENEKFRNFGKFPEIEPTYARTAYGTFLPTSKSNVPFTGYAGSITASYEIPSFDFQPTQYEEQ